MTKPSAHQLTDVSVGTWIKISSRDYEKRDYEKYYQEAFITKGYWLVLGPATLLPSDPARPDIRLANYPIKVFDVVNNDSWESDIDIPLLTYDYLSKYEIVADEAEQAVLALRFL